MFVVLSSMGVDALLDSCFDIPGLKLMHLLFSVLFLEEAFATEFV